MTSAGRALRACAPDHPHNAEAFGARTFATWAAEWIGCSSESHPSLGHRIPPRDCRRLRRRPLVLERDDTDVAERNERARNLLRVTNAVPDILAYQHPPPAIAMTAGNFLRSASLVKFARPIVVQGRIAREIEPRCRMGQPHCPYRHTCRCARTGRTGGDDKRSQHHELERHMSEHADDECRRGRRQPHDDRLRRGEPIDCARSNGDGAKQYHSGERTRRPGTGQCSRHGARRRHDRDWRTAQWQRCRRLHA